MRRRASSSPRDVGFTLVELLVVIAIIGILIALLLPAVQAAREAARRSQCTNNLKQMALAVQNHHDTYQYLPSGGRQWQDLPNYTANGVPQIAPKQNAGWPFQILPYMEQANVWKASNITGGGIAKAEYVVGVKIPPFFCPSRRRPIATKENRPDVYQQPNGTTVSSAYNGLYAKFDYAGGVMDLGPWTTTGPNGSSITIPQNNLGLGVFIHTNGVNGNSVTQSLAALRDGTSNTLMIGEKMLVANNYTGNASNDDSGYTNGWDGDTLGVANLQPRPDPNNGGGSAGCCSRMGSAHPGAFNAAFADGSVSNISYTVNLRVFRSLCYRSDGLAVQRPQ